MLVGTGDDAVALKGAPEVGVVTFMGPMVNGHTLVARGVGHSGDITERGQLSGHRAGT